MKASFDERKQKYKAQMFIAGKNRHLGYFADERSALLMMETARVRLADFFPHPLPKLTFAYDQLLGPEPTEWLRQRLEAEGAQKFVHTALDEPALEAPVPTPAPGSATSVPSNHIELSRQQLKTEAEHLIARLSAIFRALA
jgi:hypothetical protein